MKITKRLISTFIMAASALACVPLALSQSGTSVYEGDWPNIHSGDAAQRYSALDQINADNVGELEIAWRFPRQISDPLPISITRRHHSR